MAYLEKTVKELEGQLEFALSCSPKNNEALSRVGDSSTATSSNATTQSEAFEECLHTIDYPPGYGIPKANDSYMYGSCSGIEILRRMRVSLDAEMGFAISTPAAYALTDALDRSMPELFNSPTSTFNIFSPPKADVLHFIDVAFRESFWTRTFVDREFVEASVDRVYSTNPISTSLHPDRDRIALVYAVAAIGECLDTNSISPNSSQMDKIGWKGYI